MKRLIICVAACGLLVAQDKKAEAPKQPTVAELQKQVAEKDAKIVWLQGVVRATNDKLEGVLKFYGATDSLRNLDASDPDKLKAAEVKK